MTGGMAFVLDEDGTFEEHVNQENVVYCRISSAHWEGVLKALIEEHVQETHSRWGATILSNWEAKKAAFWQVVPKEMLTRLAHPVSDSEPVEALIA